MFSFSGDTEKAKDLILHEVRSLQRIGKNIILCALGVSVVKTVKPNNPQLIPGNP